MDGGAWWAAIYRVAQSRTRLKQLSSSSMHKVNVSSSASVTLCDPMDCSLPGSSIHGIFQARVLEWVAISFSSKYYMVFYKGPEHPQILILEVIFGANLLRSPREDRMPVVLLSHLAPSCFSYVQLFVTL